MPYDIILTDLLLALRKTVSHQTLFYYKQRKGETQKINISKAIKKKPVQEMACLKRKNHIKCSKRPNATFFFASLIPSTRGRHLGILR